MNQKLKNIKCTVIGDCNVGKTSMVYFFDTGLFFENSYIPRISDYYSKKLMFKEKMISLDILDTCINDDLSIKSSLNKNHLRSSLFILCFALNCLSSLESIERYWFPFLSENYSKASFILVGTKSDFKYQYNKKGLISKSKINETIQKIKHLEYIECSTKDKYNVTKVFEAVIIESIHQNDCLLI